VAVPVPRGPAPSTAVVAFVPLYSFCLSLPGLPVTHQAPLTLPNDGGVAWFQRCLRPLQAAFPHRVNTLATRAPPFPWCDVPPQHFFWADGVDATFASLRTWTVEPRAVLYLWFPGKRSHTGLQHSSSRFTGPSVVVPRTFRIPTPTVGSLVVAWAYLHPLPPGGCPAPHHRGARPHHPHLALLFERRLTHVRNVRLYPALQP